MQCMQMDPVGGRSGVPFPQISQQGSLAAAAVIAGQRAEDMKMMQEMKEHMSLLMEMSAQQAEQNRALHAQMQDQAQLISGTMQAVRQVQSQVTGMRTELMDIVRGHAAGFESQAHRRHLEARRGSSTPGDAHRSGNSPVMPEVFPEKQKTPESQLSPPPSPPMSTELAPSVVTGGLGVFAEEDTSQAHAPSGFGFNRSPPGLSLFPDGQFKTAGLTAPKVKDEVSDFNEVKRLIVSGDENFVDAIKNTSGEVLSKKDQDGMTALHYAAMHGRAGACDAILSHPGFNATKVGDRSSNTAMHTAALHDQGDVCHVILHHDSSAASVVNHFGDSPYDIAHRRGNARVIAAFQTVANQSQHSAGNQRS